MSYLEHYIPVKGHDEITDIKVEVDYTKGGRNFLSGELLNRGLYIYVRPVEFTEQKTVSGAVFHTERTHIFGWKGYKKLVKELSRKSDKQGRTLAKLVLDEIKNRHSLTWDMVGEVLKSNNLTLA